MALLDAPMGLERIEKSDIRRAAQRLQNVAVRTPLLSSPLLNEICGGNIYLKAENLQHTGSFKFRGAYNAVSALFETNPREAMACGVVGSSSGNHAQGLALAARQHNLPAIIIMPADAPAIKIERTRRLGAEIVFYERGHEDRDKIAERLSYEQGAFFIHPYENKHVVAGQGTCGLEACETLEQKDKMLDRVLVCTGGGGLAAGIAVIMREHFPQAIMHTVEPENFDDYHRSLHQSERVMNAGQVGSVCDAIITPQPGKLSFNLLNGYAGNGLVVNDTEALRAVRFAFEELKVILEPGGAVALAALLSNKISVKEETVLATLSGGNIDREMMQRALMQ